MWLLLAVKSISRRRLRSLIAAGVPMLLTAFFVFFSHAMTTIDRQLQALADTVPVTATVYNLNASQSVGLVILEELLAGVRSCAGVSDLIYTSQSVICLGDVRQTEDFDAQLTGANTFAAFPGLEEKDVEFLPGYGWEDFLNRQEAICIAKESFLHQHGLTLGDDVSLTVFRVESAPDNPYAGVLERMDTASLRIVGSFSTVGTAAGTYPEVITPVSWNESFAAQCARPFEADSLCFTASQPMELNALKQRLQELGFREIEPLAMAGREGVALEFSDQLFIESAQQLVASRELYRLAIPWMMALCAVIGVVSAALLVQGRQRDFFIMRSLGVKHLACTGAVFLEFAILCAAGSAAGLLACAPFAQLEGGPAALLVSASILCYLAGVLTACLRMVRADLITAVKRSAV